MTTNQLKYWELRWKQTYEAHKMRIEQAEIELKAAELAETIRMNQAKEQETRRHNRAMERQDFLDYQVNLKELERKWKQLDWDIQSGIIKLGIEQQNTANNAYKILSDEFFASMELALNIQKAAEQATVNYLHEYVNATGEFLKAWGGGVTALTIGEIRSAVTRDSFRRFETALIDRFPSLSSALNVAVETFGPDTGSAGAAVNKATAGRQGDRINDYSKASKDYPRYFGPDKPEQQDTEGETQVSGFTNTQNDSRGTVIVGNTGARSYSNHRDAGSTRQAVETTTSRGTTVVYSPGTHYGPGYVKH